MIIQADCSNLPISPGTIDFIYTDPPYDTDNVPVYGLLVKEAERLLKPGGFILAMCGNHQFPRILEYFTSSTLTYFTIFQSMSPWPSPVIYLNQSYQSGYPLVAKVKPIIAFSKGAGQPRIGGIHNIFINHSYGDSKAWHVWGQSVKEACHYVENFTAPGDLVLDPFAGGGTTAIACKKLGRKCISADLSLDACKTTQSRLSGSPAPMSVPLFDFAGV